MNHDQCMHRAIRMPKILSAAALQSKTCNLDKITSITRNINEKTRGNYNALKITLKKLDTQFEKVQCNDRSKIKTLFFEK